MKPENFVNLANKVYPEFKDFEDPQETLKAFGATYQTTLYVWVLEVIAALDPWFGQALSQRDRTKYEEQMTTGRFMDIFSLQEIARSQIHNIRHFGKAFWI